MTEYSIDLRMQLTVILCLTMNIILPKFKYKYNNMRSVLCNGVLYSQSHALTNGCYVYFKGNVAFRLLCS